MAKHCESISQLYSSLVPLRRIRGSSLIAVWSFWLMSASMTRETWYSKPWRPTCGRPRGRAFGRIRDRDPGARQGSY